MVKSMNAEPEMTDLQRSLSRCIAQLKRMQSDIDGVSQSGRPPVSYITLANSIYLCSEVIEELQCGNATLEPSRKKAHSVLRSLHHMMLTLYARGLN
jgi:hypothetical protein